MDTSDLAIRMKDYEKISRTRLMKRTPVICRIDGKAHHSFTAGFQRPFDEIYIRAMQETAKFLCENVQGVVLSYQQSDEISLVFVDYKKLNTSPYFDYQVQKMCSVIASMATMAFNKFFLDSIDLAYNEEFDKLNLDSEENFQGKEEYEKCLKGLEDKYDIYYGKAGWAMFDARVYNLPKEEVTNYIYWRQNDAARNSIQMVGQAHFSHKELQDKNNNVVQDMLMLQKGINWNDFPIYQKRGSCCIKTDVKITTATAKDGEIVTSTIERPHWTIDTEIPIFKGEGREYIEKLINVEE